MNKSTFALPPCLIALVLGLSSCSARPEPERVGRVRLAEETNPATPCFAEDAAPIGLAWSTTPGTYSASTDLVAFLRNRTTVTFSARVEIVARGLDGREERRYLTEIELPEDQGVELAIPTNKLPIQSVGAQSVVFLSVDADFMSVRRLEGPHLPFEFDPGYADLHVYGPHGKPFAPTTPDELYGVGEGEPVYAYTTDVLPLMAGAVLPPVSGRIEAGGEFVDWYNPALDGEASRGGTILLDEKWAPVVSTVLEGLETEPIVDPTWTMCFEHRVRFHDEGRKVNGQRERYRSTNGALMPARYLWVTILRESAGSLYQVAVFNGPLDQYGCVTLPDLTPGTYTAWTFERVQKDGTVAKAYDYVRRTDQRLWCFSLDSSQLYCPNEFPVGAGLAFTVPASGQLPPSMPITLGDVVASTANVAATYGQALFSPDNGLVDGETYVAFGSERCPGTPPRLEACYSPTGGETTDDFGDTIYYPGKAVYLGRNYSNFTGELNTATENSEHKYVAAHEMGHQIQDRLMGTWGFSYDLRAGLSVPELCTCTGLNPSGNEIHCLQSTEKQGAAQVEGYAQFFAGNVWNSRDDAECVFTYCKNFRRPDGGIDVAPAAKSCTAVVRWAETYCPLTARATEYDWMGFYTNLSRDATSPIDQTRLRNVYARMCSGSPAGSCYAADPTSWTGLLAAAQDEFGPASLEYFLFDNAGSAHGVTR